MRPTIVEYLNRTAGVNIFKWIIPSPSIVYIISFFVVALVFVKRCKQAGLDIRVSLYCVFLGGILAFIGSKLFYVALHLRSYISMPSHIFASGGSVSWGAYIGLILGIIIYLIYRRQPFLLYLDVLGSCLALGPFIGRWSCFLNGDDYGKITNVPWAVQYPYGSLPFAAHFHDGIISHTADLSAPVHPNQIYLSLSAFVIFIFMTRFWKKMRKFEGLSFCVYLGVYGILRFFLEFFRDEPGTALIPVLNFSQVMSLLVAGISFLFLLYLLQIKGKWLIKAN